MSFSASDTTEIRQTHAVIREVDLINRQVQLTSDSGPWIVQTPPNCQVFLRAERVKLRLLQPGDHVRLTYRTEAELAVALVIEVRYGKTQRLRREN